MIYASRARASRPLIVGVATAMVLCAGGVFAQEESAPASSRPATGPGPRRTGRPQAGGPPIAIEGVRVMRPGQPDLEKATIVIRGRRIVAIGTKVQIPENARKIDGTGATVTAGWIDARGTTPLDAESANDGAPAAERMAIDGLDLVDREGRVRDAVRNGVVASFVVAGRGLFAGTGALVRMRPDDRDPEHLEIDDGRALAFVGGSARGFSTVARLNDWSTLRRQLREAQKYRESLDQYQEDLAKYLEEKKKGAKTAPSSAETRTSSEPRPQQGTPTPAPRGRRPPRTQDEADFLALARALGFPAIVEGSEGVFLLDDGSVDPATLGSEEVICSCGSPGPHATHPPSADLPLYVFQDPPRPTQPPKTVDRPKKPDFNPAMDALVRVLRHEMPARFEARRADEIRAAIALIREFKLEGVIEGADEAALVLDELADAKIPVVVAPVRDLHDPNDEEPRASLAAMLRERKIPFAFGTGRGHYATPWLRAQAALAIAGGLPRDAALAAVTTGAASILGVDSELGALESGREANLVLFDGDPFDPAAPVRLTIVEGEVLYQR